MFIAGTEGNLCNIRPAHDNNTIYIVSITVINNH